MREEFPTVWNGICAIILLITAYKHCFYSQCVMCSVIPYPYCAGDSIVNKLHIVHSSHTTMEQVRLNAASHDATLASKKT